MSLQVGEDGVAIGRDFAVHDQLRQPSLDPTDLGAWRKAADAHDVAAVDRRPEARWRFGEH